MTESRQQRRARERAERKAATRPGPNLRQDATPNSPKSAVVEVELRRYVDDDDPTDISWVAEWGLKNGSVGTEDTSDSLSELIANVLDDLRQSYPAVEIEAIEWDLDGDSPPDKTMAEVVAAEGVTLPDRLHVS